MSRAIVIIVLAVFVMGCGSDPCFYSFRERAFVPLGKNPARKQLVGRWETNAERLLVLRPDGIADVGERGRSCWDVDGRKLLLRTICANYGALKNSAMLAINEVTYACAFELTHRLVLKDCPQAGEYWREKEPTGMPPARR
jgi:hypothetical protein